MCLFYQIWSQHVHRCLQFLQLFPEEDLNARWCLVNTVNKLNTASNWLLLRMNWAQANKYGYHLHIDFGIVVTDPFRSNLSTTMSSAIVSEGQHIVNVSFRDHFSLVLCYYWVVWISPLLSYDCWFFPLRQHGFFGLNSKLHLGLVFKIGFCFIEEWILDKKRYLWFVFGLFVFQGIQLLLVHMVHVPEVRPCFEL